MPLILLLTENPLILLTLYNRTISFELLLLFLGLKGGLTGDSSLIIAHLKIYDVSQDRPLPNHTNPTTLHLLTVYYHLHKVHYSYHHDKV